MVQVGAAFEENRTGRVVLQDLLHGRAEMVMQRRAFPDTYMTAFLLVVLINLRLENDADALHEEDTTEHGNHQLLVNDHRANTDDSADSQAAGVAEEDLRREAVEPQITHQRTDKRREEDNEFFAARDVHDVKIFRPDDAAAGVCEYEQGYADYRRVAGTHAVHAIVQVRAIADCRDDENRQQHEENPSEAVFIVFARPAEQVGVVEVMVFDEGNGGLRGLDFRGFLDDGDVVLDVACYDLVHRHRRRETERQTDNQSERHLSGNLDPAVETVFVFAEGLDIIVRETECAHEQRGYEQQNHIDVGQFAEQQTRQQNGDNDNQSAHGRHTFLGDVERVEFLVALRLGDVVALHVIDEPIAEPDAGAEGNNARHDGAEGNVIEQARAGKMAVGGGEVIEEMI